MKFNLTHVLLLERNITVTDVFSINIKLAHYAYVYFKIASWNKLTVTMIDWYRKHCFGGLPIVQKRFSWSFWDSIYFLDTIDDQFGVCKLFPNE